jgi:hypothetical protein
VRDVPERYVYREETGRKLARVRLHTCPVGRVMRAPVRVLTNRLTGDAIRLPVTREVEGRLTLLRLALRDELDPILRCWKTSDMDRSTENRYVYQCFIHADLPSMSSSSSSRFPGLFTNVPQSFFQRPLLADMDPLSASFAQILAMDSSVACGVGRLPLAVPKTNRTVPRRINISVLISIGYRMK